MEAPRLTKPFGRTLPETCSWSLSLCSSKCLQWLHLRSYALNPVFLSDNVLVSGLQFSLCEVMVCWSFQGCLMKGEGGCELGGRGAVSLWLWGQTGTTLEVAMRPPCFSFCVCKMGLLTRTK